MYIAEWGEGVNLQKISIIFSLSQPEHWISVTKRENSWKSKNDGSFVFREENDRQDKLIGFFYSHLFDFVRLTLILR